MIDPPGGGDGGSNPPGDGGNGSGGSGGGGGNSDGTGSSDGGIGSGGGSSGGGGSDSGGSGSWGISGGGSGGGGGPHSPKPPRKRVPWGDYTPLVTVDLDPNIDGPGCFIESPRPCTALVNVTVPDPGDGKLKVATISVTCFGKTKLGALAPGGTQGFSFTGKVSAGQVVTATATASAGDGIHAWTGSGEKTCDVKDCIKTAFTWTGDEEDSHRCPPQGSESTETGWDFSDSYTVTRKYAINPEPGTEIGIVYGKDYNPPGNRTQLTTSVPDGQTTTVKLHVDAPGSVTCQVSAQGGISNVEPHKLGIVYDGSTTTQTDLHGCTTQKRGTETGP